MLRLDRFILILSIVFLLLGCASGVKLDPSMKSKLDDGVTISTPVKIVVKPYYNGSEQVWGAALGGAIGAIVAGSIVDESTKIKQYLEAENIDVASIVLDEFTRQISYRSEFAGRIRDDGKYRLELEIPIYGLVVRNAFTSNYKPMLALRAKLIAPEGKIIWQNYNYVTNLNSKTPTFTYKDYFRSPEAFEAAFSSAAEIVVSLVLDDLK